MATAGVNPLPVAEVRRHADPQRPVEGAAVPIDAALACVLSSTSPIFVFLFTVAISRHGAGGQPMNDSATLRGIRRH